MSLRTSRCPFPQKEQDRLPWWWLSFRLMSPPLHASVRAQREGRQPSLRTHVGPLSESIDVSPVTPETRRSVEPTIGAAGRRHAPPVLHDPRGARTGTRKATRRGACLQCHHSGPAGRQPGLPTVQQAFEDALAAVLAERVQVHGAARTDAGVHAEGQVASFTLRRALRAGDVLATPLPHGLRIDAAAPARPSFHARASAAGKRYRYRFADGSPTAWDLGAGRPDWDRARAALQGLREVPHLSGLASPSPAEKAAPPLDQWSLLVETASADLVVQARAFRKHEVRNLAGQLVAIALGLAAPESLARLACGKRPWRGTTAPAQGLTLLEVLYPPDLDPFR